MSHKRSKALDEEFALRRVPPNSSHWRPAPHNKPTSFAYHDKNGEVSVDMWPQVPPMDEAEKYYSQYIKEKGVGYTFAQVKSIKDALKNKNIEADVLHDPLPENTKHGVITGPQSKAKERTLADAFSVLVQPKPISEVFGN